jgi:murein DD-endopeptidase MepM/ murein hydrolase activator NlpD
MLVRLLVALLTLVPSYSPTGGPVGGPYQWPLAGPPPITRAFQPPPEPWRPGHRGVDLGAAPGDPVRSAGPGVVAFAGVVAGRPVVSVDHPGGLRTTYEPVSPLVQAGQPVAAGSVLGTLLPGHAGCPVAACLHWGLRQGTAYLDPLALLGLAQVRLLPLSSAGSLAASRSYSSARL